VSSGRPHRASAVARSSVEESRRSSVVVDFVVVASVRPSVRPSNRQSEAVVTFLKPCVVPVLSFEAPRRYGTRYSSPASFRYSTSRHEFEKTSGTFAGRYGLLCANLYSTKRTAAEKRMQHNGGEKGANSDWEQRRRRRL